MRVCAAGKGMVFKSFSPVQGLVIRENWSSIGSRLKGLLTKNLNEERLSIFGLVYGHKICKILSSKG